MTPAELGEISGRGEDWLEMMSNADERRCEQEIERRRRRAAAPARTTGGTAGRTGWSRYSRGRSSRLDQAGGYIADSWGLTSPAATRGECHYCGGPLVRGECRECR